MIPRLGAANLPVLLLMGALALSAAAVSTVAQETTTSSVGPYVVMTSPHDRESYVAANSTIDIEFSEPMRLDSVLAGLRIRPETDVAGTVFSGNSLSILIQGGLKPDITYLVNISTVAASAEGLPLEFAYGFHFHTGPKSPAAILWGEVKDAEGKSVPDATVEIVDVATEAVVAIVMTDAEGKYYVDLRPGRQYYLRIHHPDGNEERTDPFDMNTDRTAPTTTKTKPGPGPGPISPIVEPHFPWSEIATLGTLLGLGLLAGAWALGGEAARYALMMSAVSLYARMRRDRRRDEFVRGQIYGHILSHPGTTYGVIQRTVGVGNGTLSYHLYHLEGEGFVRSERDGWFRRLYPAWAPRGAGDPILSDIQRKIVAIVETDPGSTQSDIAMLMGESRQMVNYNVSRLVQSGFLRMEGWGSSKKCFLSPPVGGPVAVMTPHLPRPRERAGQPDKKKVAPSGAKGGGRAATAPVRKSITSNQVRQPTLPKSSKKQVSKQEPSVATKASLAAPAPKPVVTVTGEQISAEGKPESNDGSAKTKS